MHQEISLVEPPVYESFSVQGNGNDDMEGACDKMALKGLEHESSQGPGKGYFFPVLEQMDALLEQGIIEAKGPDHSDPVMGRGKGFEALGTGMIGSCAGDKGLAALGAQGRFNGGDACFKAGGTKQMIQKLFNGGGVRLRPKPDVTAANQALVREKSGKRPLPCT